MNRGDTAGFPNALVSDSTGAQAMLIIEFSDFTFAAHIRDTATPPDTALLQAVLDSFTQAPE